MNFGETNLVSKHMASHFEIAVLEKRYGAIAAEAICVEIAKAEGQNIIHFKLPVQVGQAQEAKADLERLAA